MRSFENIDEDNVEEWPQSHACEVGFHHMTDIANAAENQKGEEEGRENESEICTPVRSLNSSQKQAIITNCFSK
jgi:hypothetical protein